jgi:hypothetical protein
MAIGGSKAGRAHSLDAMSAWGERPWFQCCCARYVMRLYSAGRLFACRQCCGLAYANQQAAPRDRHLAQARKIRDRLGGDANVLNPFPLKPSGMHWQTYDRLRRRHDRAPATPRWLVWSPAFNALPGRSEVGRGMCPSWCSPREADQNYGRFDIHGDLVLYAKLRYRLAPRHASFLSGRNRSLMKIHGNKFGPSMLASIPASVLNQSRTPCFRSCYRTDQIFDAIHRPPSYSWHARSLP